MTINASLWATVRVAGVARTLLPIFRTFCITALIILLTTILARARLEGAGDASFAPFIVFILCCSFGFAIVRAHVTIEISAGRIRVIRPGAATRIFILPHEASVEVTDQGHGIVKAIVTARPGKYELFAYLSPEERDALNSLLRLNQ